jgi:hypothetical protein
MTSPEDRTQTSRQRQEQARADWLRRTLERSRRPMSPETRRKLAALLAPFGDQGHRPPRSVDNSDTGGSRGDHRGVRVGRIVPGGWPGSGTVRGDGV